MKFYIITNDGTTGEYIDRLRSAAADGLIEFEAIEVQNIDFLVDYLDSDAKDITKSDDMLIPSHNAPHVLAQVMIKLLERHGHKTKLVDFPAPFKTPYEAGLRIGIKAISYTNEECIKNCPEPEVCPVMERNLDWDIGKLAKSYAKKNNLELISFECAHLVNEVAAIKMKEIAAGWLKLMSSPQKPLLIITHSKCHGIAALVCIS